ncbi:hypothetical protein Tco_0660112, partial [Tanacetum coccineum]
DIMESFISYETAKSVWTDLVHSFEVDVNDSPIFVCYPYLYGNPDHKDCEGSEAYDGLSSDQDSRPLRDKVKERDDAPLGEKFVIIEQRVKVNQNAYILELKRRNHEESCYDNLYALSIKEDTVVHEQEFEQRARVLSLLKKNRNTLVCYRPKIDEKARFKLKGQFLKELRDNTFIGSDNEDANEHIEKVLEIVDLFHIPEMTQDQIMLRVFAMSLTGAANRWLRNEPAGSIVTWETLKTKFLSKYYPPTRTTKKMEEINNFQQKRDETLYQACERFKELLLRCPQHYLTDITSTRTRSTDTSDGLAAIQAQLKQPWMGILRKVNEYSLWLPQVGCVSCGGNVLHYGLSTKGGGKTLREALLHSIWESPFPQGGRYRAVALGFYQRDNGNPSYQERRQTMKESLGKFMAESAKRHDENSNFIKEIRALMDVAIKNQGTLIKALVIQISANGA